MQDNPKKSLASMTMLKTQSRSFSFFPIYFKSEIHRVGLPNALVGLLCLAVMGRPARTLASNLSLPPWFFVRFVLLL